MEQVTHSTRPPTAPEAHDSQGTAFQHAHQLTGQLVAKLAVLPFAVEVQEDFPSGWRVHLKFRHDSLTGLQDTARLTGAPVTSATTEFGMHVECLARIQDVEIRASIMLSGAEAEALEEAPPTEADPAETVEDPTDPAHVPDAVVSVRPAPDVVPLGLAAQEQADPYDQSLTRYVASLGGSTASTAPDTVGGEQ